MLELRGRVRGARRGDDSREAMNRVAKRNVVDLRIASVYQFRGISGIGKAQLTVFTE